MADQLDQLLFGGQSQQSTGGQTDELDQLLFGGQQTQSQPQSQLTLPESTVKKSPISIMERLKLSFADDAGREKHLKNKFSIVERLPNGKFVVGNSPDQIAPIDPEGVFNDVLGDLADVVSEIPILAGQIGGATLGTLAQPGIGTVLGGAAGAGTGQSISAGIGQTLGVREAKAVEEATDVAIASAFGAGGEILGQGLKHAGRGLAKLAKTRLDKAVKSSANPPKMLQALGKIFKVTAAVNPDDVVTAGLYGFDEALSPKYMNKEYSQELMTKFTKGLILRNKALGKMVGQGDDWAVKNFGKDLVNIEPASNKLLQLLSDPKVGMLDDLGRLNPRAFTEASDFKAIRNLTESLFAKRMADGSLVPRKLSVKQLIDFKKQSKPLLNKYFKSTGKNPLVERGIAQYLDEVSQLTGLATLPKGVTSLTDDVIAGNPYLKANRAFSNWKQNINLLKQNGLDVTDINDLGKLIRNGNIVSDKMERFFEAFNKKGSSAQKSFELIAQDLPVKFSGKGINGTVGTLADELKKYNAAQGFANANPNFLRIGAISGLVGVNLGRDDPGEAALSGGLGLLLATPAGTRLLLRAPSKLKAIPKTASSVLKHRIDRRIATSTLSTLLRQADKERKKKSSTTSELVK